MYTEYEATFYPVDKDETRTILNKVGAKLIRPEFMQKRVNFYPPKEKRNTPSWLRVRDEGDKVTMSFKANTIAEGIDGQKEICLVVDDYNRAIDFLDTILERKAYQETKRELWELDGVEISIDTWPWLESFVEVEGKNEAEVRRVSEKLGFDYSEALFCAVGDIYCKKYSISYQDMNNKIKIATFELDNPFK